MAFLKALLDRISVDLIKALDWSTKGSATIDYLDQNTFEAIYSSSALVYMLIWVRLNNKSTELPPHVGSQRIKSQMFIPPTNRILGSSL